MNMSFERHILEIMTLAILVTHWTDLQPICVKFMYTYTYTKTHFLISSMTTSNTCMCNETFVSWAWYNNGYNKYNELIHKNEFKVNILIKGQK